MKTIRRRSKVVACAAAAALGLALMGAASPQPTAETVSSQTVEMHFIAMTKANAAAAGYEVRTNLDGTPLRSSGRNTGQQP